MWNGCFGGAGFGSRMMFGGYGGYGGWFGILGMILHLALFIGGIYLLVRLVSGIFMPRGGFDNGRALAILKEQYARGEMTREEYQERKSVLES